MMPTGKRGLKPSSPVQQYPVYCIVEPFSDEGGMLAADLFIINLTGKHLAERDMITFLQIAKSDEEKMDTPDALKFNDLLDHINVSKFFGGFIEIS
jgi:hypothetical protein